jgi:xanthine dehydrogenase accessory factor
MIAPELASLAERLTADRAPFAIATVVRAQRPTSVRAGDSALVLADGSIEGFVGGACAESSVRLHGLRVMETGEPLLLRIVPEGTEASEPTDGALVERNPCLSGGALEIFLDPRLPRALVVVVGHSPIADAIAELAVAAGYEVERDGAPLGPSVAAVVVSSHGSNEEGVLAEALRAGVQYVALVASKVRGKAVREALDVPDELRAKLHTPAGLDIGARTPAEIAISILAELVVEKHAHPAGAPVSSLASATDPVCGMDVAIAASTPRLDVGGRTLYFCGAGCRDAYAEPHLHDAATR